METYYTPEDLPKFEEIGKDAPELAKKFFDYYQAVFRCSPGYINYTEMVIFRILNHMVHGICGHDFLPIRPGLKVTMPAFLVTDETDIDLQTCGSVPLKGKIS